MLESDELFSSQLLRVIVRALVFVETLKDLKELEKFQTCSGLLRMFRYAWRKEELAAQKQWKDLGPKEAAEFVRALVNNFARVVTEMATMFVRIKYCEKEPSLPAIVEGFDDESKQKIDSFFKAKEAPTKFLVNLLIVQLGAISELTKVNPEMFATSSLALTFACSLNFCLRHLTVGEFRIHCKNMGAFGFDIKEMLSRLVEIYGNCYDQPGFAENLCEQNTERVLEMFQAVNKYQFDTGLSVTPEVLVWFKKLEGKIKAIRKSDSASGKGDKKVNKTA